MKPAAQGKPSQAELQIIKQYQNDITGAPQGEKMKLPIKTRNHETKIGSITDIT